VKVMLKKVKVMGKKWGPRKRATLDLLLTKIQGKRGPEKKPA